MLDDTLKAQLQQDLALLRQPILLVASLDDSETGTAMKELLQTIVGLSDKVSLETTGNDARKPSFEVVREGETQGVRFAGLPLGHEFTSLVLALLWTGDGTSVQFTRRSTLYLFYLGSPSFRSFDRKLSLI